MKSMRTLAVAAALALTGAGFASAATVYHVSGSTAFRSAVVTAEVNYLKNTTGGTPFAVTYGATAPSSLAGSSTSVILSSDSSIEFQNDFTGSIAGVESVNGLGSKLTFPNGTVASGSATFPSSGYLVTSLGNSSAAATGGAWSGGATSLGSPTPVYPDIIFSDVSSATAFTVVNSIHAFASQTDGSTEASGLIGVVPFVFIANTTTDISDFSGVSVSPQGFNNLWSSGHIKGSYFTGVSADSNITVYAIGRDIDSGTRATALCETGYGLGGSGAGAVVNLVTQYYPFDSTTANTGTTTQVVGITSDTTPQIAKLALVPASNIDGAALGAGDGGYASGGNLGTAMTTQFNSSVLTHTALIGYIGLADLASSLGSDTGTNRQAPIQLAYNGTKITLPSTGILPTADQQKIENGSYTFWTYEHEFFKNNNSVDPTTVANTLQTLLSGSGSTSLDQISSGGVTLSAMVVARNDDGLAVQ